MSLIDFIKQYYINPVTQNQGYNFVNTLTYAIALVLAVWLIYKFLEKRKIAIDRKFVVAMITLVVFGTMVRLLEESGILVSYYLVTPMIWVEMIIFIFALFFVSRFIEKRFKIPYYKTMSVVGVVFASVLFVLISTRLTHFEGMAIALGLLVPFALIFYFVKWKLENKLVSLAHIFDSTATFTAVQFYGFRELHVVPRLLMGQFSPVAFIIVKLVAIIAVLIMIDKYSEDKNFNRFLKLIIAIIGLGPAIRDFFLLGLAS